MSGRLVKVVLALTAVTFAVAAESARAAFPGTNGPIALEQSSPTEAVISGVNADGTGARQLVTSVGFDRDAAWSPDGRRLAFTSTRTGNEEIFVLDVATGMQRNITGNAARDHDPTWSPDGSRLAFASGRDGDSEIYVIPVTGGATSRLTFNPAVDQQPAWSSTGVIAFASNRGGDFDLHVMDSQGGGLRRLTLEAGSDVDPSWAPDGSRLAYAHHTGGGQYDVYSIGVAGGTVTPLVTNGANDRFPAWSPDGTKIAFASNSGGREEIWITPAGGPSPPSGLPVTVAVGTDPNWGPLPPPVGGPDRGRTITLTPAGGAQVLIGPSPIPVLETALVSAVELPVGATIDATHGSIAIDAVTRTPDGPGTVGQAVVRGGIFRISQTDAPAFEPALRLLPGVRLCPRATTAKHRRTARMRIRARGWFRSVTGNGRAAGRGTEWIMHDRCDGTAFKVLEGIVLVRDYRRNVNIRLRAGQCYLAARQRRRDALRPRRVCPRIRPPR